MPKYKFTLLYKKVQYIIEADQYLDTSITNQLTFIKITEEGKIIVASFPSNKVAILKFENAE